MTLPLGHRIDHQFVCMRCLRLDDHREHGIGGGSAVDERMGSGLECTRCGTIMPWKVNVRIEPDGQHAVPAAPDYLRGARKMIETAREERVLVEDYAMVSIRMGPSREVRIRYHRSGAVEVYVFDSQINDEQALEHWEHKPDASDH